MKIAYNSAYVQTGTLNFTFARQAAIVYFYLCSNFQTPNINLQANYFLSIISVCTLIASEKSIPQFAAALCCSQSKISKLLLHFSKFLVIPNFDLETNYIFRKPTTNVSNSTLAGRKSHQIFSREPNIFLCRQCNGKSHTNLSCTQTTS